MKRGCFYLKRLDVINYLKGFSIFTIVFMHLFQNYLNLPNVINKGLALGGAGVHIFILCSGFGLYLSYLNKKIEYKEFLKKRFSKIYIPYILVILISASIPIVYNGSDRINAVLSHMFLFKMFFEKYECSFGMQFWFISTIVQFYLAFYILIRIKNRIKSNKTFFILSLGISFVWWILVFLIGKSDVRVWNSFFLQYLWEFCLGMVLAEIYYFNNEIKLPKKITLILFSIIGIGITGITGVIGGALKSFNDIPSIIGYGSMALLLFSINNNFINNVFIKLSKISYEWYLTHILVFDLVFKLNFGINKYVLCFIAFTISIIISKLYNYILINSIYIKNT